ncbi:MAG: site-specific integrase [Clostridia bacterium]|nr:site-specific integrase [Clostridia bacterium]
MTFETWLLQWLENYVAPTAKRRTKERYAQLCKLHIIPALGTYRLDELSVIHLQSFITQLLTYGNKRTGKALSANTVNCIISVIQNALKTAYLLGLSPSYDGNKLKRPKMQEKRIECFSLTEQKQIEAAVFGAKKDKLLGVVLCLYTGLRIGELLALSWEDIDFEKGLLTVTKTCHDGTIDGKRTRLIDRPKTDSSRRIIPLPKQIVRLLKAQKSRAKCDFLIADGEKPVFVRSYQRSFELLLKKIHIPHRGFHSLRHTFATRALECGIDVKTLSELLGHKNATITLNRYVHSLLEHKTEMMNRLGKLL